MRTLIALAAITAISGCAAAMPENRPAEYSAPNKLVSCSTGLPQDWEQELARDQIEAGSHEKVTIVAANEDVGTTLVKTTRNKTTELVLRDSKRRQQVMAVKDDAQLFGVEFDGRWVTFATTPNPENHTVTAYAWDSRADGAPMRIGGSGAVVHNGKAAWSDTKDVHLYDLAKKKDGVVGQGTAPAFFGDMLLWSQNGGFRAAKLDRTEAALPEALQNAKPGRNVASDGRTVVWTEGDTLYGWRTDWPQARKLAEIKSVPMTESIVLPRVSGDFVSWRSESPYVTDIRSGATMHTTDSTYWLEVHGGALTREGWEVAAATPLSRLSPLPGC
jgi:hypothetical protein